MAEPLFTAAITLPSGSSSSRFAACGALWTSFVHVPARAGGDAASSAPASSAHVRTWNEPRDDLVLTIVSLRVRGPHPVGPCSGREAAAGARGPRVYRFRRDLGAPAAVS